MCRYATQSDLLIALLKYSTVILEYIDLFNLNIIQILFWIIEGMDKRGQITQGLLHKANLNLKFNLFSMLCIP